jgi:hypothetical protein
MNPQLKQKLNIIEPLNFTEMKKISKLVINPEKLMKNEELLTLRGGYSSYECYRWNVIPGICSGFLAYINTASCNMAKIICKDVYNGDCVDGGDC